MKTRRWLFGVLALSILGLGFVRPELPAGFWPKESDRKLHIRLERATAEQLTKDVLFRCHATFVNETSRPIDVKSHFFSAFDGLELVVLNEAGEKLFQQPYTYHQSPGTASPRLFLLKPGETREEIRFPIRDLPAGTRSVKVLLIGTLPGVERAGVLCSNLVEVKLPEPD